MQLMKTLLPIMNRREETNGSQGVCLGNLLIDVSIKYCVPSKLSSLKGLAVMTKRKQVVITTLAKSPSCSLLAVFAKANVVEIHALVT